MFAEPACVPGCGGQSLCRHVKTEKTAAEVCKMYSGWHGVRAEAFEFRRGVMTAKSALKGGSFRRQGG